MLLKKNGLSVSPTGYFVYTNANVSASGFNDHMDFETKIIPYDGDDSWIEPTLKKIKQVLNEDSMPPVGSSAMGGACEFCSYARARTELTLDTINCKPHAKRAHANLQAEPEL